MILLDMRSLIVSTLVTDTLCLLIAFVLWRQNRGRFQGTGCWTLNALLQVVAAVLLASRGAISPWLSVVLANTLLLGGMVLLLAGLRRFLGLPRAGGAHAWLLLAFASIHATFTFVSPDLVARYVNLSVFLLVLGVQGAWLMLRGVEPSLRPVTRDVGWVLAGFAALCVLRLLRHSVNPEAQADFMHAETFEKLVVVAFQALFLLLSYALVLMVNRRLLHQVLAEERKFALAFENAPYAVAISRLEDGRLLEVNRGFCALFGYGKDEALGRSTLALGLWVEAQDRARALAELATAGQLQRREFRFRRKSGEVMLALFSADPITVGGERCLLSSIDDITQRKAAEEQLQHMAQHDALTGLPNRALFAEQVRQALAEAHRDGTGFALLVMDLDRFKQVNDTLGHDAGDRLLKAVAGRLSASVRESDIVARIGGDEFVALLRGAGDPQQAMVAATKMRAAACTPCVVDAEGAHAVPVALSIGIALYPLHGTESDALFRLADAAMYRAKSGGAGLPVLHAQTAQPVQE